MFVRNGVVLGSVVADPSRHRSTRHLVVDAEPVGEDDEIVNDAPEAPAPSGDSDDAQDASTISAPEPPPADDTTPPPPAEAPKAPPVKVAAKKAPAKAAFKSALDAQKG